METRTEMDFCEAVRQIIATAPEKEWVFVCDGLNTHKSEMLVKLAAQECHLGNELGKGEIRNTEKASKSRG